MPSWWVAAISGKIGRSLKVIREGKPVRCLWRIVSRSLLVDLWEGSRRLSDDHGFSLWTCGGGVQVRKFAHTGKELKYFEGGRGLWALHCSRTSLASISRESDSSASLKIRSTSSAAVDARKDLVSASAIMCATSVMVGPAGRATSPSRTGASGRLGQFAGPLCFAMGVLVSKEVEACFSL